MWKSQKVESAILSLLFYIYNKRYRALGGGEEQEFGESQPKKKKLFNYFMRRGGTLSVHPSILAPISFTHISHLVLAVCVIVS